MVAAVAHIMASTDRSICRGAGAALSTAPAQSGLLQGRCSRQRQRDNLLLELPVVFGIASAVNRGQEVIHDKVGYLAAHASAAGQISAEMDAGENSA